MENMEVDSVVLQDEHQRIELSEKIKEEANKLFMGNGLSHYTQVVESKSSVL